MSKSDLLATFQSKVGQEVGLGEWLQVEQDRINLFADATEDHQWIHIDRARAQTESPFKDTVAHGFLTLSLLPSLTREVEGGRSPYPGAKLAVNYGLNRVRFPSPVRVNSRVRARTVLKEVSEVGEALQLTREITVEIEGQDKPACVAETLTRLYF